MIKPQITFEDFGKVDIRVGRVIRVEDFPEAYKPTYDFANIDGDEFRTSYAPEEPFLCLEKAILFLPFPHLTQINIWYTITWNGRIFNGFQKLQKKSAKIS